MKSANSQKRQRRSRGRAWYWQQTDSWYFTPPGTKQRVRLFDDEGRPVRGQLNGPTAELSLARVKADGDWQPTPEQTAAKVVRVVDVCSRYLKDCERRLQHKYISEGYNEEAVRYLNDLCEYCGALTVAELRKGYVQYWLESHPTWKSSATRRLALTIVMAAFNAAEEALSVTNPLVGLEKPDSNPRLCSFTPEDEQLVYEATDEPFGEFLFAAIQSGLRPYCELARLTAGDVLETDRGMQWRVHSSKTDKTRVIPIRQELATLTKRLIKRVGSHPDTVLFRNSRGGAWKKGTGVQRFRKIREELGWNEDPMRKQYSSYTCRHTFAHRMLAGYWNQGEGCSIEVLAELMGDTPKVAFDHYGREWGQHYRDPLWSALGM